MKIESFNNRKDQEEERISNLKDKTPEITPSAEINKQQHKRIKQAKAVPSRKHLHYADN